MTAQQVDSGTGSLTEFALEARERAKEYDRHAMAVEQGLYFGCLVRQEGPWRSGSTYVVSVTPDFRILVHAKDMSLSGRRLSDPIAFHVLHTLGVPASDLVNLLNPDTFQETYLRILDMLEQEEPEAAFDATAPIPGVSPGVPGAYGHVAVYNSPLFQSSILMFSGFDIDSSHLVEEEVGPFIPTVTARDVVDRETLKAFVTAAGNYVVAQMEQGYLGAASKARADMRNPNGHWRHGSVYLYVWDLDGKLIIFHGGFPDIYELMPLRPVARDAVTGEFILPQLIAAVESGPEGGFVEYYFDDPNDDADSVEIPKVGYVRAFSANVPRGGTTVPVNYVVGSGFYESTP